jgi:glutamine---fructose-6-phosphate transaminase (isomerizing)
MCGITFILSKKHKNVINDLLASLKLIQNRGYDSMGIAFNNRLDESNKNKVIKYASTSNLDCYDLLVESIKKNNINSHIGLGHTRWATHGSKTDINSHPHISQHGKIILVHNGIINNFYQLKERLLSKGVEFKSDTDSEVIANLIEYYLVYMNNNIQDAIKNAVNELDGTWALVIIYTEDLDTYYVTRKGSPLLLGENDNYIICTSEVNGFNGLIYNYIVLEDIDLIEIKNNEYKSIGNNSNKYEIKKVAYDDTINLDEDCEYWMKKEIMEQPDTIQKAFNYGGRLLDGSVKLGGLDQMSVNFEVNPIKYILLIGCGTSYNAGLIGENYFKDSNNFKIVKTVNACEFSEHDIPNIKNPSKILCIFLSQSGETIDVYNCLNICKQRGCITMGVINKVDSLIARNVNCGVYLNAGSEISVASTKSFTSMVIILSLINLWFSKSYNYNYKKITALRLLSSSITCLLNNIELMHSLNNLKHFIINKNINSIFILGKDNLYPVALEGALKIKEVTYIHCEGFSAGSLKHGPFALLDNTNLSILLIDYYDYSNYVKLKSTYHEIFSRNTNLKIITNSNKVIEELQLKDEDCILLNNLNYYNEIIFTIALQHLAYIISLEKGINPDKPRNLAKVVTVE